MRDALLVWKDTKSLVQVALVAALYAAALIPSKPIVLVPGFTEIRPATALPIVLSFLLGPAAGWGAGLGNLIGDFFGTLGPGSLFGVAGNFLLGLLPYQIYRALPGRAEPGRGRNGVLRFAAATLVASAACGFVIGWGVDRLGLVPFRILGTIILVNDALVGLVLGLPLLLLLARRIRSRAPALPEGERARAGLGAAIVALASILGFLAEFGGEWGGAAAPAALGALALGVLLL